MPPKDWTDDEVQEEIRKAVQIVAEDREKASYLQLHEKYGTKADPGKSPPPKKDGDTDPQPKPKRSLWWGNRLDPE